MESWLSSFGAARITDFPHSRWLTLFSIWQLVVHPQFWKSGAAHSKGCLPSRQYLHYRTRGGMLAQDIRPFFNWKMIFVQCMLIVFFSFSNYSQTFPPHYPPNSMSPISKTRQISKKKTQVKQKMKINNQKSNKTERANTTQNETKKKPQKYPWVHLLLVSCSWIWDLPWNMVAMPSEGFTEENWFSLCQSQAASWLVVEP